MSSHLQHVHRMVRSIWSWVGKWADPSDTAMLGQPVTMPEQAPEHYPLSKISLISKGAHGYSFPMHLHGSQGERARQRKLEKLDDMAVDSAVSVQLWSYLTLICRTYSMHIYCCELWFHSLIVLPYKKWRVCGLMDLGIAGSSPVTLEERAFLSVLYTFCTWKSAKKLCCLQH